VIDDDQEIEIHKPIDKDPLGRKQNKQYIVVFVLLCLEHTDLFGGAVSESDEEETSQKGWQLILKIF
jgi:hypothetical protein